MESQTSPKKPLKLPKQKNKSGFFYIIKTSDTPENVYKIGKTTETNPNKRLCTYPQYSSCLYTISVKNADIFEKIAIHKLKGLSIRHREFGYEYYEINIKKLINIIHSLWMEYGDIDTDIYADIRKNQPEGWQYFANEWLANNPDKPVEIAYKYYVDIITSHFRKIPCKFAKFEPYYYSVMF